MKDKQIGIQIQQLAKEIYDTMLSESDTERNCRLQDTHELLRQAYMMSQQLPLNPNDLITQSKEL